MVIRFMGVQLQNAVFQPAKGGLLACKRYSFMMQKASSWKFGDCAAFACIMPSLCRNLGLRHNDSACFGAAKGGAGYHILTKC